MEITRVDALEIGIRHSIEKRDYGKALIRLEILRQEYVRQQKPDAKTMQTIRDVIGALEKCKFFANTPSREDYIHGAEQATQASREEELAEWTRASTAPTRKELDERAEPYLKAARSSYFRKKEDVCWIDGVSERESTLSFQHDVEGTGINLCGRCAVDYQVKWRPENSPIEPNVRRYAREKNSELFFLLAANSL